MQPADSLSEVYHTVQTCSGCRRSPWQALLISVLGLTFIVFVINTVGLSFVSMLLVPIFSIVLFQLAYGYTWTSHSTCPPISSSPTRTAL